MSKFPRWQFLGAQDIGDDPYLDRLRVLVTPWFSIYLHHIHRADQNAPHDHPWWFSSLVLTGRYREIVYPDKKNFSRCYSREHGRFSWHSMSVSSAHEILFVEKPLWTLVITGPAVNTSWGFYPGGKFVPWHEYSDRENITAGWPAWKQKGTLR